MPTTAMDDIHQLLVERNKRETTPFVQVYEAYASLLSQVDALQVKCSGAELEAAALRQQLQDAGSGGKGSSGNSVAIKSALKNETRLRDKLERLQEEYNLKLKSESDVQSEALKTANKLRDVQGTSESQEKTIALLREDVERSNAAIDALQLKVQEAESQTSLAEAQYDGLKVTIRALQEENDALRKENREFEGRLVAEKGKTVDEMNTLTEMVDRLKIENDMLKALHQHEMQRNMPATKPSWFGSSTKKEATSDDDTKSFSASTKTDLARRLGELGRSLTTRKFGEFGRAIVPTEAKQTITAHTTDGTSVRYDDSAGSNLVATSSSDGSVKVWDTTTGAQRYLFRGSAGHSLSCCDLSGLLIVAGGSDKTCRVWNLRTERMIHHLVGHQHKITCVRLFGGDKGVVTGSADRSLKVWDIRNKTYRQTTTLRHSSTSTCVDVGVDAVNAVSGHMDGGLRLWDLKSGERTGDMSGIHEGGIASVQFNPADNTQVLTNSFDSTLKIVDIRAGHALFTFRHAELSNVTSWASCAIFSPDGLYVATGSNSTGAIFVWNTSDGQLKTKLSGVHATGVVGMDWCIGSSSGQQVASLDRKGVLVLWA